MNQDYEGMGELIDDDNEDYYVIPGDLHGARPAIGALSVSMPVQSWGRQKRVAQRLQPKDEKRRSLRNLVRKNYQEIDHWDLDDDRSSSPSYNEDIFEASTEPFESHGLLSATQVLKAREALLPSKTSHMHRYLDPRFSTSGRPGRAVGRVPGSPIHEYWDNDGLVQNIEDWRLSKHWEGLRNPVQRSQHSMPF